MKKDDANKLEYCSLVNAEYAPEQGCSIWRATCNYLVCMSGGVGILSFPYCILLGGWFAIAAMCVIPVLCCYTATLLMDCLYQTVEQEKLRVRFSWESIAEACLPRCGKEIIVVTRCIHFLLICSLYLMVSGALLQGLGPLGIIDEAWWQVICTVIVFPTVFLTNWSAMAWMSLLGVLSFALACVTIIPVFVNRSSTWSFDSIAPQRGIEGIFIAVNAILLGYNAHDMLPFIEESMNDKTKINFVVFFSYGVTTPIKLCFSVLAFLSFTGSTEEIVLQNLQTGWIKFVASIPTVLNCLCIYAPTMYGIIVTLDDIFLDKHGGKRGDLANNALFILIRVLPVLISLMIAELVPSFALFCSFISSIIIAAYAYIFPAGFHLYLKRQELTYCQILGDIIFIFIGFASAVMGVFFSSKALLKRYSIKQY